MNDKVSDQSSAFPLVWKSILWIILYFILQIVITLPFLVYNMVSTEGMLETLKANPAAPELLPIVASAALWGIIFSGALTIFLIWVNIRKEGRADAIGLLANSRLDLARTLGLGVALIAGAMAFSFVYSNFIIPGVELQDQMKRILEALPPTFMNTALKVVAIAGIAPIVEELLFRGYLQNAFGKHMNHHGAIWLAALIFGLVHMELAATPALMVLGAAFGYLYHLTGSLKTNIALHMINNGLALAFL
jgi:membrane protease YdiL (CAAX protease family)